MTNALASKCAIDAIAKTKGLDDEVTGLDHHSTDGNRDFDLAEHPRRAWVAVLRTRAQPLHRTLICATGLLHELGYSRSAIDDMRARGIV